MNFMLAVTQFTKSMIGGDTFHNNSQNLLQVLILQVQQ